MSENRYERRPHTRRRDLDHHGRGADRTVIVQYPASSGAAVRNEVRGDVSGVVVQIAGDHHGDLTF